MFAITAKLQIRQENQGVLPAELHWVTFNHLPVQIVDMSLRQMNQYAQIVINQLFANIWEMR